MNETYYSLKKVAAMFGGQHLKEDITRLEQSGEIGAQVKFRSGALYRKGFSSNDISKIGEKLGFFKTFNSPTSLCVFTTKGGVLKSTLALNLARTAALHGLKTCVVGLDIQGDVTTALGFDDGLEDSADLNYILEKLNRTKGLSDIFNNSIRLNEAIVPTDLENLFLIPETPELVALNDSLSNINRREFWLKEKVIDPLKQHFDLVIMDCSPNWNKLTTNALVACDALISPLECKINNFRNFKVFSKFLEEFKQEMRLDFESIFVPTRYSLNRKLSQDILSWYRENVDGCIDGAIREGVSGEEATALNKSFIEHCPGKPASNEIIEVLSEVHRRIEESISRRTPEAASWQYSRNQANPQESSWR
ncbi:ParA family protein [Halobacteriovorax sp. HLS]|uniref:ParA family protein n=1 Tax=Halobacteriovorax sp. HLS TaxID=2234000 RepID=UPI000FD7BD0E|nr:AAA family ATPase [Halobacteriovorax sp. HLS]